MIHVVTDGSANLPSDLAADFGVEIVRPYITFGSESFRDGVDLTSEQFYERLRSSQQLPTTSQPSPGDFSTVYQRLIASGDRVVSIHVTGELSGTTNAAVQAAAMFPAGAVTVVESHWVSLALAFQVRAAAVAVGEGGTVQDAVLAVQALEGRLGLFFLLETLDNLRKGGRISAGAALVGGLLHVKPILQMQQGRIGLVARARSMQSGVRRLVGMVASQLPGSAPVHVGLLHARAPARMAELEREVRQRLQVVEVLQAEVGPAIGVHVGEGAVGLAFYTE